MQSGRHPHLQPGETFDEMPAQAWNDMMDVIAWWRNEQQRAKMPQKPPVFRPCNCIRVRNTTGDQLLAGAIVAIGDSYYDPAESNESNRYKVEPVFDASAPTLVTASPARNDIGCFAVVQETISEDAIGYAAISGVVNVTINMAYQTYRYADIGELETDKLFGREYGGAEIIHVEGQDDDPEEWEAGDKLALVRIGAFHNPLLCVKWVGSLSPASTITAYVFDDTGVPADPTDPANGGRQITLGCSLNQSSPALSLGDSEYAWAQLLRTSGVIELASTPRQFITYLS